MSPEVLAWGVVFLPFAGFVINALLLFFAKPTDTVKRISGAVATLSVFLAFLCAVALFPAQNFEVKFFEWIGYGGANISAVFDNLSKTALLYVLGVSSLIHLYSIGYMWEDEGFIKYFVYLNLFVFFMVQIVVADNLVQLFLGWEGVGLCSYLLIGFWYSNPLNARAGLKAFVTNRIGDFGFLVGIALALLWGGTVSYEGLNLGEDKAFWVALALFAGAMGKSAQGPLWLWLPDAMRGPTPVSALIHAATMVTAGVYMVVRLKEIFLLPPVAEIVGWIAIITSLLMGFFALWERDIKRILAFSTLSQLGLMFWGAVAVPWTGIFHVFEHAFFKALLFLISGVLMHAFHEETDIWKLREHNPAKHGMVLSWIGFLVGALAMSGIFPLSGFWSKEAIMSATAHKFGDTALYLGYLATFITPLYMFRAFFVVFGTQLPRFAGDVVRAEGGATMFFPLLILTILSVVGGAFNVGAWLGEEYGFDHTQKHSIAYVLKHALPYQAIAIFAIALAWVFWGARGKDVPERGLLRIFWRKLYLNEIEEGAFAGGGVALAKFVWGFVEKLVIEGIYALSAFATRVVGKIVAFFHGKEPARILMMMTIGILIAVLVLTTW